jgi:acetyl esterase/lipase
VSENVAESSALPTGGWVRATLTRRQAMTMHRAALTVLFALSLAPASSVLAASRVQIVPDVVYGHKDGLAMTLDVLRPEGADGAAVIYMVSGGWVSRWAPPEQSVGRFQSLLDKGFTVFVVRHGSSPRYLVPDAVADVRRAVRFIRSRAKDWGVDAARMGVHGGSAGGHLSLVLGTASDEGDPTARDEVARVSNRVASVVAYFPPVDLRPLARGLNPGVNGSQRFPALNFPKEEAPAISPILQVSADDPPTLLIHGDADELVNVSNSERMYESLQQHGVKAKKIILPGAGHGFRGEDAQKASAAMVAWFEETLKK